MTSSSRTPRNLIAGGFVTAVLLGLGASPAAGAHQPLHVRSPAPPRTVSAVLPGTGTRNETQQVPTSGG